MKPLKRSIIVLSFLLITARVEASLLYENDFEDPLDILLGAGSIVGAQGFNGIGDISGGIWRNTAPGNPAANSSVNLAGGPYSGLHIEFDFMAIDSWDGTTAAGGIIPPDFFNVTVNSGTEFSETVDFAIEADGSISTSAAATLLSSGSNLHTVPGTSWPDTVYHIALDVLGPVTSPVAVSFFASGAGWQGGNDESWAIDNLRITSVPEPTTLALMGLGLFGMAYQLRRKMAH